MLQIIVSKWHITAGRPTYNWSLGGGGPQLGGSNHPALTSHPRPASVSRAVNEPSRSCTVPGEGCFSMLSRSLKPVKLCAGWLTAQLWTWRLTVTGRLETECWRQTAWSRDVRCSWSRLHIKMVHHATAAARRSAPLWIIHTSDNFVTLLQLFAL